MNHHSPDDVDMNSFDDSNISMDYSCFKHLSGPLTPLTVLLVLAEFIGSSIFAMNTKLIVDAHVLYECFYPITNKYTPNYQFSWCAQIFTSAMTIPAHD